MGEGDRRGDLGEEDPDGMRGHSIAHPGGAHPLPVRDSAARDLADLFAAIAADHRRSSRGAGSVTEQLVSILSTMRGRAAVVWTDTRRPDRQVWLARAGLCPLAVGTDTHGGLWWASNPAWLRYLGTTTGLMLSITLLPEGSIWTALPHRHRVTAVLVAEFKPTVRRCDLAIAPTAVWRGFTPGDEVADQSLLRHRTVA